MPENSLQLNVAVFSHIVDSGIRTMRLRYNRVNPIVIPKPGSTRRFRDMAIIKTSTRQQDRYTYRLD
jgi:hypothetical protein